MTLTYHAAKEALHKINSNLSAQGTAMLASPYVPKDAEKLYDLLISFIPVGTEVKAVYLSKANELTSVKEFTGKVTGHFAASKAEPSFHISDGKSTILLPGSVLEIIK